MEEQINRIRQKILEQMDVSRSITDEEILDLIEEELQIYGRTQLLSISKRSAFAGEIFNSLRKLDVLQELIDDEDVTEIMVNGMHHIFYEKKGQIKEWPKQFSSREKLEDIIQLIVGKGNRMVNEASPIVDTRLKDGSRVNVVLHPIALDGSVISIRKFPKEPMKMADLISFHSISEEAAAFLEVLVKAGYNIFVSGGTGSGKTTFLNALSEFIPKDERIVTIEDSAELQLNNISNLVRLETRNCNTEGTKEITIRDLIRTALRMRPDRVLVGECRGAEALDMLQAMNTGHDGSLSTGHANSCQDMLSRLETMTLMAMNLPIPAIRGQIASGIDIFVHLGRMRDKSRKVLDIMEVDGMCEGEIVLLPIYQFKENAKKARSSETVESGIVVEEDSGNKSKVDRDIVCGVWEQVGALKHREKLIAAGLEV